MKKEEFIELVQQDLKNERKHLAAYAQFATTVQGLHREELKEFFEEEAASELKHVLQFSQLIVYLGGVPNTEVNDYPTDLRDPKEILQYVADMEDEVADNYAERLRQTEEMTSAWMAYCHIFYEDQIQDSWENAQHVRQMVV